MYFINKNYYFNIKSKKDNIKNNINITALICNEFLLFNFIIYILYVGYLKLH